MLKSLISVLIPVYNEKDTIEEILKKVHNAPYPDGFDYEVICVNDASTDGTTNLLKNYSNDKVVIIDKLVNQGKGAAIKTALEVAQGDIIIIQDADLEYNPNDYPKLIAPIIEGHADVVFGSRFLGGSGPHRVLFFWHSIGNKILTFLSNMLTNLNLTDMETCYKVFTRKAITDVDIKSRRFGIEPELTAKFAKKRLKIYEVPISYYGRDYQEGKKITWRDGISAMYYIFKYNLFN
ncbi:MAG: glycosyltransferase family 2 protein [Candidatus Margulisbacteria bacterium]|nr:glycosyltransferase family 2 protein [Candidatus Margulisiibacteriota bacterium]